MPLATMIGTPPKLRQCKHIKAQRGDPRVPGGIGMMHLECVSEHVEPINDITALCIKCTAEVIALLQKLEAPE